MSNKSRLEVINARKAVVTILDSERVHAEHLLHRSVHIIIVDSLGRFYLRQRPETKTLYPTLWTSAVGAHVVSGQTPKQAAEANLQSFLGVMAPLVLLGKRHVEDEIENELASFFLVKTDNVPLKNPDQSMDQGFKSLVEIDQLVCDRRVTPYVVVGLELYQDYIKQEQ